MGTGIGLHFDGLMAIQLYGRNLDELFMHLLSRQVIWIQENMPFLS
jgi:hypothetical protein